MKDEIEIAKENNDKYGLDICQEHKQSCKRFLEFLKEVIKNHKITGGKDASVPTCIPVKIQDLKKTIKEYEKNGV